MRTAHVHTIRLTSRKGLGLAAMLDYKTSRAGGQLVRFNAALTSQSCHVRGEADAESRENHADFVCRTCDHGCHADVNAAHNILVRATPTGEDTRRGTPQDVRCQPPETSRLLGSVNEEPPDGGRAPAPAPRAVSA